MAADKTTNQYLSEIAANTSGGGLTANVNVSKVNGSTPDLATETTLALVPEYIGSPSDGSVAGGYDETVYSLAALLRGFWRAVQNSFESLVTNSLGLNTDDASSAPSNTATVVAVLKGFWQQLLLSTGIKSDTQATTSIVSNTETASADGIIPLLKLLAAKTRGQTTTRAVNCTLGGGPVIMDLKGQTYMNWGFQIIAATTSSLSAITITVTGSSVSTTAGGNYELLKSITIPASAISQRTYDIMLNTPVRTLRFDCTGGATGTGVSITASCY